MWPMSSSCGLVLQAGRKPTVWRDWRWLAGKARPFVIMSSIHVFFVFIPA